jgi:hypothetical protein
MLRSYLIFLMTHSEKGLNEWVNIMKRTPINAILSGFDSNDLPGVVRSTTSSSAFGLR